MPAEGNPPPADRRSRAQSDSDGERRPSPIPFLRTWKIAARTLHLLVTYLLVAAHLTGAARSSIEPLLWVAIVSGAAMAFLEVFPNLQLLVQGWACSSSSSLPCSRWFRSFGPAASSC